MAISLTSYALDREATFPKVTLPDFQIRAEKAKQMSTSDAIVWFPLVEDAERQDWEEYTAIAGPEWIRQSLDQSGMEDAEIPEFSTQIHNGKEVVDGPIFTGDETLSNKYSVSW